MATAASLLSVDGREDARRAAIMRRAAVALREGVLAAVERRAADLRAVLLRAAVLRAVVLRAGLLRAAACFTPRFLAAVLRAPCLRAVVLRAREEVRRVGDECVCPC